MERPSGQHGADTVAAPICSECRMKTNFANTTDRPGIFSQPHCNPYPQTEHESILTVLRIVSSGCRLRPTRCSTVPDDSFLSSETKEFYQRGSRFTSAFLLSKSNVLTAHLSTDVKSHLQTSQMEACLGKSLAYTI